MKHVLEESCSRLKREFTSSNSSVIFLIISEFCMLRNISPVTTPAKIALKIRLKKFGMFEKVIPLRNKTDV